MFSHLYRSVIREIVRVLIYVKVTWDAARRGALERQVREHERKQQQTADSRIPNSVWFVTWEDTLEVHKHNNDNTNIEFTYQKTG